jgi:hypothetical protein
MECPEHERLERIHIQRRTEMSKAAPTPGTEEFQRLYLAESQALEDLKDHDAEHGCQRSA